jgi:hypothetical protein
MIVPSPGIKALEYLAAIGSSSLLLDLIVHYAARRRLYCG